MKRILFFFLLFLILGGFLWTQEPAAVLIYSEGEGFFISREDDVIEYDLYLDDVAGFEFYEGDFIATSDSTFLEIQMYKTNNILKISENTSFTIVERGSEGGGSFAITYGRVRAKVQKLTGNDQFSISSPSVVAGIRGTDFGYDLVAESGDSDATSLARVYCFEGKVEVNRLEQKEELVGEEVQIKEEVVETVILEANQMVTTPPEKPEEEFDIQPITEEVKTFWDINDFRGELIQYELEPEITITEEPEKEPEPEVVVEEPVPENRKKVRKGLIAGGASLAVFGTVVGGVGGTLMYFGDDIFAEQDPGSLYDTGKILLITGSAALGSGLITMIIGFFVGR